MALLPHRSLPRTPERWWSVRLTRCGRLLALAVPLSASATTEPQPAPSGAVVSVTGRCTVKTGEVEVAAQKEQTVRPGDVIACPAGAKLRFTLPGSGEERTVGKEKERDEYTVLVAQSTRSPPGAPGGRVTNTTPQSISPEGSRSAAQRLMEGLGGMVTRNQPRPAPLPAGSDSDVLAVASSDDLRAAIREAPLRRCDTPLGKMHVRAANTAEPSSIAVPLFAALAAESKCFVLVAAASVEPVEAPRGVSRPESSPSSTAPDYVVSLKTPLHGSNAAAGRLAGRDTDTPRLIAAELQFVESGSGMVLTRDFVVARDPRASTARTPTGQALSSGSRTELVTQLARSLEEMTRAAESRSPPPARPSMTPTAASAPDSSPSAPAR